MKCVICKDGEIPQGYTTVTLEHENMTLVIKQVPARICENCGEAYVDEEIAARLMEIAESAADSGVQVEVREYVAA